MRPTAPPAAARLSSNCGPLLQLLLLAAHIACGSGLTNEQMQAMGFSTGPPQVLDICADDNHFCEEWALHGECDRNPRYMLAACQHSCRRCLSKNPDDHLGVAADPHMLSLTTPKGKIDIVPYHAAAPLTVSKVKALAKAGCARCRFYRAEGNNVLPSGRRAEGILQGTLHSLPEPLAPIEGNLAIRRGHVAIIPNTMEFFIALRDHPEYGAAHTVWGEVTPDSMAVADRIARLPTRDFLHPLYAVPQSILRANQYFSVNWHFPGEDIARQLAENRNITLEALAEIKDVLPQLAAVDVAAIAQEDLKEAQEKEQERAQTEAKLARKEDRKIRRQQRTQAATSSPDSASHGEAPVATAMSHGPLASAGRPLRQAENTTHPSDLAGEHVGNSSAISAV